MSKIEIEKKGKEERQKNKINQQQERKKEDSTQGEYALAINSTHTSGSQGAYQRLSLRCVRTCI